MLNQNLLLGDDGYLIQRSLRFRSSASAYLNRTPASAGNRKTWTWSGWVKRGALGSTQGIFGAGSYANGSQGFQIAFQSNDTLRVFEAVWGSATVFLGDSVAVYRDPSAYYHIVVALDTTQATSTNRLKIYVNGQLITLTNYTAPALNTDYSVNGTSDHTIARAPNGSGGSSIYFDGYLTEVNFIDGQALTPSSFGETDAQTGVWKPKRYAGTYGTNGFYLNFSDNSAATAATIGKDSSGNGNNWTPNNISVTSGATYDSMTDVPTLRSTGAANYAVLNPLTVGSYAALSNANLRITGNNAANSGGSISTIGSASGKWYFESIPNSTGNSFIGAVTSWGGNMSALTDENNLFGALGGYNKGIGIRGSGTTYGNAAEKQTISAFTFAANDVIGVAIDADNGAVYFSVNGSWLNSGVPTSGSSRTGSFHNFTPSADRVCHAGAAAYTPSNIEVNFGQRPFSYTPPTGFKALNTFNLPEPIIKAGNKHFDVSLYTGTYANQTVTNSGSFQPDLVWTKGRSYADYHALTDAVRGASKWLPSNGTNSEFDYTANDSGVKSFVSNGFTLQADGSGIFNQSGQSYVAWQWKANGSGSSNTAGTITSTVSANPTAGFSIVTYTGTGASATVGHGLGVAPKMIIVKCRSTANPWPIYHASLGVQYYTLLNATSAADNSLANYWSASAPSSSVFGLNSYGGHNQSGQTFVAYCFSEIAGYSKFGSYTGNGSSDGPFVHLGFRPRFIMIKNSGAVQGWCVIDTARAPYNLVNNYLTPNNADAESSGYAKMDILSNGFKLRETDAFTNGSSNTYIYMAFAENPFKYSLAR